MGIMADTGIRHTAQSRALTAPRPRSATEARCCPGRGAPLRPREPPSALLLKRGLTGPLPAQGPVLGVSDASACARVLALLGEALAAEILVPDAAALAARGRGDAGEEPEDGEDGGAGHSSRRRLAAI